ncbi:MAG TPA: OmpA family protein [Bacteroidia bacterium]|nr:OmpA family protein [Bacteroidia bacterium]HMU19251.1 OmpA family protein [Bacteroidia bacterium]
MKKLSLLLLSIACIFSVTTMDAAKAKKSKTAKADKAFNAGKYAPAADLYKKAYGKQKSKLVKAEIAYKAAECYSKMSNSKEALNWYEKSAKDNGKNPDAVLKYAQALKTNGRYDEAVAQFNAFKALEPGDNRGQDGATSSETSQQWKDKPTKYNVENVAALNTKYFDFAVATSNLEKNTLYFTSSRAEASGNKNDAWYGEKFYDIFKSTQDNNGKWSIPTPISEAINTAASEGAMTFDAKGNVMYFTRCQKSDEKGKEGQCKIYKSVYDGAKWGAPELLPFNSDNYTCGQPSLSEDGTTLYFASDMPGGAGGKDIWMTKNENNAWSTPVNISSINTAGDEMFPYIAPNGKMYFSSNGHMGMGGLDIFTATLENGAWANVTNLKYPINSSWDDFGMMFNTATTGYLTSNRDGGQGQDDIYSFVVPPANFAVYGRVYDTDTKEPISGATVELFGSDGTQLSVKTQDAGTYRYELKPDVDYKVSASFTGYLTQFKELTTKGLDESKDFEQNFDFPLKSTSKPIALPEIFYDLDKYSLRPESKAALDGLIKVLNDNPTITIKLTAHTDFRADDNYNLALSKKRALAAYNYLVSKKVDKDRLSWEGRGEKDAKEVENDEQYLPFKRGDKLTEEFIKGLSSDELKEKAHQYNRRTEFTVLSTDYTPKKAK